jgi:hypothetical protein
MSCAKWILLLSDIFSTIYFLLSFDDYLFYNNLITYITFS